MPIGRPGEGSVRTHTYVVIGERSGWCPGAVGHVGLLAGSLADLAEGGSCDVFDSGPPLHVGDRTGRGSMRAHWVGDIGLTDREVFGIRLLLANMATSVQPPRGEFDRWRNYSVLPAEDVPPFEMEGATRVYTHARFSCAGFVTWCYRQVEINLIDQNALPALSRSDLEAVWGPRMVAVMLQRMRSSGSPPPDAAPILHPSYIFHAIEAGRAALPFRPDARHTHLP